MCNVLTLKITKVVNKLLWLKKLAVDLFFANPAICFKTKGRLELKNKTAHSKSSNYYFSNSATRSFHS